MGKIIQEFLFENRYELRLFKGLRPERPHPPHGRTLRGAEEKVAKTFFDIRALRIRLPRLLFLLFALLPTARTDAGDLLDMSLESLMNVTVVGASRYEQKITEAPSYASILTAEDIKKNGYRTLADLLRTLPGVYTSYNRIFPTVGFRGFLTPGSFNSRVLLLVDGHVVNNSVYEHAPAGNDFPVDIDLVERVEVVRGPSSSLYGANAFFGVINVITKRGRDIDGVEVSGGAGSWRTFSGRATMGKRFSGGPELLLSGSASDSVGQDLYFPEYDNTATNNGVAENDDNDKYNSLFAKASLGGFTVEAARAFRKKDMPTGQYGTAFNDDRTNAEDQSGYVDLRYEKDLAGGVNLLARTYFDRFSYNGDHFYSIDPTLMNKNRGDSESWGVELKAVAKMRERHRVTAGGEFRYDFRKDQQNFYEGISPANLDSRQSSKEWAAYLKDEFRIHPKLILNAGVRYDRFSTFGGTTNPRLGLIWMPREKTAAKLLYGRAFRAPNTFEMYFGNVGWVKPNPGVRPETIRSYEAVLEQFAEGLGADWKFTASAYHYHIKDLITLRVDPADGQFFHGNNQAIEADGVELEAEGKLPGGIGGRASYAFQRAEYTDTGSTIPNSPKHMAKLTLSFPLLPGILFLSPEAQYIGRRQNTAGKPQGTVQGYFVANATLLATDLPWGLELSASVYNLFDQDYADPAGSENRQNSLPQDGRSYRVKATCRF